MKKTDITKADGRSELFVTHDVNNRLEIVFVRRLPEPRDGYPYGIIWVIRCLRQDHRAGLVRWLEQREHLWPAWRAMIETEGVDAFERHFGALIKAEPAELEASVLLSRINVANRPALALAEVRRVGGGMRISQVWHRAFATEAARAKVDDLLRQPEIMERWEELAEWAREDPSTIDRLIDRALGKKTKPQAKRRQGRRAAAHA